MTRAVCVWPQNGTVRLSGAGYEPPLALTGRQAVREAKRVHEADPLLSAEIAACLTRMWNTRRLSFVPHVPIGQEPF